MGLRAGRPLTIDLFFFHCSPLFLKFSKTEETFNRERSTLTENREKLKLLLVLIHSNRIMNFNVLSIFPRTFLTLRLNANV